MLLQKVEEQCPKLHKMWKQRLLRAEWANKAHLFKANMMTKLGKDLNRMISTLCHTILGFALKGQTLKIADNCLSI